MLRSTMQMTNVQIKEMKITLSIKQIARIIDENMKRNFKGIRGVSYEPCKGKEVKLGRFIVEFDNTSDAIDTVKDANNKVMMRNNRPVYILSKMAKEQLEKFYIESDKKVFISPLNGAICLPLSNNLLFNNIFDKFDLFKIDIKEIKPEEVKERRNVIKVKIDEINVSNHENWKITFLLTNEIDKIKKKERKEKEKQEKKIEAKVEMNPDLEKFYKRSRLLK